MTRKAINYKRMIGEGAFGEVSGRRGMCVILVTAIHIYTQSLPHTFPLSLPHSSP